jgi:hypothetical protein
MITIAGAKVNNLSVTREGDKPKLTGQSSLMTSDEKVLAKQSFNDYGGMEIAWSAETTKAIDNLLACVKNDIHTNIGVQ